MIVWKAKREKLSKLRPAEYNPKKPIRGKMRDSLRGSLEVNGQADPIVCNLDLTIIGGHQRVDVMVKDLEWTDALVMVPDRLLTKEEEKTLNLALNHNESPVDDLKLAEVLYSLHQERARLDITGLMQGEINRMIKPFMAADSRDTNASGQGSGIKAKQGEVYVLGKHKIMCGDCKSKADTETLLQGESITAVFTDPPYGVDYDQSKKSGSAGNKKWDKIKDNDLTGEDLTIFNRRWLEACSSYLSRSWSAYICFADKNRHLLIQALKDLKIAWRVPLVWVKNSATLTWDRYNPKHETIIFCGPGSAPSGKYSNWHGPKNENTVWNIEHDPKSDNIHPTQKPVQLME